jgi:hypothetical protein
VAVSLGGHRGVKGSSAAGGKYGMGIAQSTDGDSNLRHRLIHGVRSSNPGSRIRSYGVPVHAIHLRVLAGA